jgi:hypothetical protein
MRAIGSAFVLLPALAGPASAAAPACRGKDVLEDFARARPEAHAEVVAAERAEINTQGMLWRIDKPGGGARLPPSWLFGTIHLTDERVTALSPNLREALGAAKVLALEVENLTPQLMAQAMAEAGGLIKLERGRRLADLLTPAETANAQKRAARAGLPAELVQTVRPWFLATLLSVPACEEARKSAGLLPLDLVLRKTAKQQGAKVVGLETIAGQLRALASLDTAAEVAWLKSSLALYDRIDDLTETLVRLYLARRMGAVFPLSQKLSAEAALPEAALAQFKEAILYKRNERMHEAALPLVEKGAVLIGVGALHLPGERGMVEMMRRAGYTLTPVE